MAEVRSVFTDQKILQTFPLVRFLDYLNALRQEQPPTSSDNTIHAAFFVAKTWKSTPFPMKNVSEAMGLRNALLENFERALTCSSETERQELLNVVIVGE